MRDLYRYFVEQVLKKSIFWRNAVVTLAAIVVFTTTYALILPAITMEAGAVAGTSLDEDFAADRETPAQTNTDDHIAETPTAAEPQSAETDDAQSGTDEDFAAVGTGENIIATEIPEAHSTEDPSALPAGSPIICDTDAYQAAISFDDSASLPEGTVLNVRALTQEESQAFLQSARNKVGETAPDNTITTSLFYQLQLTHDGEAVLPAAPVDVRIDYKAGAIRCTGETAYSVLYSGGAASDALLSANNADGTHTVALSGETITSVSLKQYSFDQYGEIFGVVCVKELETAEPIDAEAAEENQTNADAEEVSAEPAVTEAAEIPADQADADTAEVSAEPVVTESAETPADQTDADIVEVSAEPTVTEASEAPADQNGADKTEASAELTAAGSEETLADTAEGSTTASAELTITESAEPAADTGEKSTEESTEPTITESAEAPADQTAAESAEASETQTVTEPSTESGLTGSASPEASTVTETKTIENDLPDSEPATEDTTLIEGQTYHASAGSGYAVEVTTKDGTFAEDVDLYMELKDELTQSEEQLLDSYGIQSVQPLDIYFETKAGDETEPQGNVNVALTVNKTALPAKELGIYHIVETNGATRLEKVATIDNTASAAQSAAAPKKARAKAAQPATLTVEFATDSFSTYVIGYTVDFEYNDLETGEKYVWSWPGEGSYSISDIMAELGVDAGIGVNSVDLSLVEAVDETDDSALYLEEKDDGWYLTSDVAFDDTYELTVVIGEKIFVITLTDDDSQTVNKGTAIEAYFIDGDGVRQDSVSVKTGEVINARVKLENSSATAGDDAYVKVTLDGLSSNYISMTNSFEENDWDTITIRDSLTHDYKTIGVYFDTAKNELIYRVPPGTTAIASLSFMTPNGITPNGEKITLIPAKCDDKGNTVTPADNDEIGSPASGTWTSKFGWDDIQKYVNNVKSNVVSVDSENTLSGWLAYTFSANSQNNANVGVRWTDTMVITDTLTLPDSLIFPDMSGLTRVNNNIVTSEGKILFGFTLNSGMELQDDWSVSGKTFTYSITVTNQNTSGGTLTGEMANLNYQAELNLEELKLRDGYINTLSSSSYNGEDKIANTVRVTETPVTGPERPVSDDTVTTTLKASDGYKVEKDSLKDGQKIVAGDLVDYTITLSNTGAVALAGDDLFVDYLPDTLIPPAASEVTIKIVDSSGQETTGDINKLTIDTTNNQVKYDPSGLLAGSKVVISFNAKVVDAQTLLDMNVQDNDTITNYVRYKDGSDYASSVIREGKLIVKKTGTTTNVVDDDATVGYTIAVTHDSDAPVPKTVMLWDNLPPYLKLKIYDKDKNEISSTEVYDGTAKTYKDVYIKAGESDTNYPSGWDRFRHVKFVTIDENGFATITIEMDGSNSKAQYYGYEVVFDASKVEGSGSTVINGIVQYDNVATTNTGDSDTETFHGKTGEVGIEKYWDNATLDKETVTEPFEDGTIITYNIVVTNDLKNPYNYDIDVTDYVPAGLFPVGLKASNGTAITSKNALTAYLQADNGNENTLKAAKLNDRDVKIRLNNGNIEINWTIPNNTQKISSETITYQCKVVTDDINMAADGTKVLKNTAKTLGKEAYAEVDVHVKGVTPVKQILDSKGNLVETIDVGPGETTTYVLTIRNESGKAVTLNDVKDFLPYGGNISTNYWVLGETVFVETEDTKYNQIVANTTENNGSKYWMNSGYLYFGAVNMPQDTTSLTQKVSIKWPEDPDLFRSFWTDEYNRKSKNEFYINASHDDVDHKEKTEKKYYLQKNVLALGDFGVANNSTTENRLNSKDLFKVGSVTDVFYSIVFANTGTSTLHIDSLIDQLPDELEFVGIASSDYLAGSHQYVGNGVWDQDLGKTLYPGIMEITTNSENTNPSFVMPGYHAVVGEKVHATVDSVNNTVTFQINNGEGVDLPEKYIIYFNVQCKIKQDILLENGQAITNTVQAQVDSDADLKKTSITTQRTPSDYIQNNGGCEEIADDGTTKTAQSSVSIHPMEIAVPGILKEAVAYRPVSGSDISWKTDVGHMSNIETSQVELKWRITLYNDGTIDLNEGYTLTDNLFWYDVYKSVESYKIYNASGDELHSPSIGNPVAGEWSSIKDSGEYRQYTWTFDSHADYVIPSGGKAVLTFVTGFDSGTYQGRLDNMAVFSPKQDWDANRVIHGQLEKNTDGSSYIGVSSSDYVNMYGEGATVSYKSIQEKDDETNIAYGYNINSGNNKIVVSSSEDLITYTNVVKNLSTGAFKTFVMIDRLPALNDVGTLNANQSRGSEFPVSLADSISVSLYNSDGSYKLELEDSDYTIEYAAKDPGTGFTNNDWAGSGDGWSKDPAGANVFRIVLNPGTLTKKLNDLGRTHLEQAVFPSMWTFEVTYDAQIDPAASAGQIAYNSFGYRYIESGGTTLEAEPPMVGVSIPKEPVIRKIVLDEDRKDLGVDETKKFTFTFYEGTYTPEQIEEQKPDKLWETEVYQGQALKMQVKATVNGTPVGYFENGKDYTVVETPVEGYSIFKYEVDGLTQKTKNYSNFKFDSSVNTTVVAYNLKESGFKAEAEKTLKGRALQDKEFEFELYEVDASASPETLKLIETVKNDGNGKIEFSPFTYDNPGTYKYQMKEKAGSDTSIKYDETVYELTVTVTQAGDILKSEGVYKKIVEGGENVTVSKPVFENEEVTSIEVEKVWAGNVDPGTATMVLYQAVGDKDHPENDPVPSDSFRVNVQASLADSRDSEKTGTPKGTANITATFTAQGETPIVVTLNNGNNWSDSVVLKRGKVYSVNYATNDAGVITNIATSDHVTDITDPETLNVTASAVAARQYNVVFNVSNIVGKDGTVNVEFTHNGVNQTITLDKDHASETLKVTEEDSYSYVISSANGFISGFSAPTALSKNVSSAGSDERVDITAEFASTTMYVPVSVTWNSVPDKNTYVDITFTPSDGSEAQTVRLDWANLQTWNGSKTLKRFDANGNLLTWTPSYKVTIPEGGAAATITNTQAAFSGSGSVAYTGEVARGMNLIISVPTGKYMNSAQFIETNSNGSEWIKTKSDVIDGHGYFGPETNNIGNLPVKENGIIKYYGIVLYGNYKVTTNISNSDIAWGNCGQKIIYVKAQAGDVYLQIENDDTDEIISESGIFAQSDAQGLSQISSISITGFSPKRMALKSGHSLIGISGSRNKTFYDNALESAIGTAIFTSIQAKDLPVSAEIAENVAEYEKVIRGNDSASWTNLPTVDASGNPIYYYVVEKDATADADEMTAHYSYEYNKPNDPTSGIKKVTIKNTAEKTTPTTGKIIVQKTWDGVTDQTDLAALQAGFSITVAGTDAGGNNINTLALNWDDVKNGGCEISGLPLNETYSITESFTSEAQAVLNKYTQKATSVTSFASATPSVEGNTYTLKNEYERRTGEAIEGVAIDIHKVLKAVNNTETDKSGIKFVLSGTDANNTDLSTEAITDTNGKATITLTGDQLGKHYGAGDTSTTKTFTLTENNVPIGYDSDSPWTVTVKADGVTVSDVNNVLTTTYKWKVDSIQADGKDVLTKDSVGYKIINTQTTVSLSVNKTWGNGQSVPEGSTIKVKLTAKVDNQSIKDAALLDLTGLASLEITMDGSTGQTTDNVHAWTYKWGNLPKYDSNQKLITYSVEETEYKIGNETIALTGDMAPTVSTDTTVYNLILTNKIPTTDITGEKKWGINAGLLPNNTSVELTLKATVPGSSTDGASTETLTDITNFVLPNGASAAQTVNGESSCTWTLLPKYYTDGQLITYTVSETKVTVAGNEVWNSSTADAGENPYLANTSTSENKTTFTNKIFNVQVLKVDSADSDKKLSGAKFQLRRKSGAYQNYGGEVTTPTNGQLDFSNLPAGDYELEETKAPDGYAKLALPIHFTITKEGTVSYTTESGSSFTTADNAYVTLDSTGFKFTVKNQAGATLPSTGGPGTRFYHVFGLAMILFAGSFLLLKRKSGLDLIPENK